jgi:diacylglycerol kinase (CTP)
MGNQEARMDTRQDPSIQAVRNGAKVGSALYHRQPVALETPEPLKLQHRSMMNWPRKIFHMLGIGTVGLTLALCSLTSLQALMIVGVLAALLIGFDLARLNIPALNEKCHKDFRAIMRDYENRRLTGITWFMAGLVLVVAIAPVQIAGLGVLLLAFGDPWASFFGIRFGKTRLMGSRKTLEGMLGGFAVCAIVSALYLTYFGLVSGVGAIALASVLAAAVGSMAEALPVESMDDNFTIPVVATPGP